MDGQHRVAARIAQAMAAQGLTRAEMQRRARLDNKTLQSALEGKRKSSEKTLRSIERALDLTPGELDVVALAPNIPTPNLSDAELLARVAERFAELRRENDSLRRRLGAPDAPTAPDPSGVGERSAVVVSDAIYTPELDTGVEVEVSDHVARRDGQRGDG